MWRRHGQVGGEPEATDAAPDDARSGPVGTDDLATIEQELDASRGRIEASATSAPRGPADVRDEKLRYIEDADRQLQQIEATAAAALEQLAAAERDLATEADRLRREAEERERAAAEIAERDSEARAHARIEALTNELSTTRSESAKAIKALREELDRERAERASAIADAERRTQEAAERARAAERAGAEAAARARTGAAEWLRKRVAAGEAAASGKPRQGATGSSEGARRTAR